MRNEYDFSGARRGALAGDVGKSRITIYLDNAVLGEFRARAEKTGTGYQTMINDALKAYLKNRNGEPVTEDILRRVIREEIPRSPRNKPAATRPAKPHAG